MNIGKSELINLCRSFGHGVFVFLSTRIEHEGLFVMREEHVVYCLIF